MRYKIRAIVEISLFNLKTQEEFNYSIVIVGFFTIHYYSGCEWQIFAELNMVPSVQWVLTCLGKRDAGA